MNRDKTNSILKTPFKNLSDNEFSVIRGIDKRYLPYINRLDDVNSFYDIKKSIKPYHIFTSQGDEVIIMEKTVAKAIKKAVYQERKIKGKLHITKITAEIGLENKTVEFNVPKEMQKRE